MTSADDPTATPPYAWGGPAGAGIIKATPGDFVVEEVLGFEPSGNGEHVFLKIEKAGENTEYLARQLARLAGVRTLDVGYAGLKDRHARTVQWFSIGLAGKSEPNWSSLDSDTVRVLECARNSRKLRKGALAANRFELMVRALAADRCVLEDRLHRVAAEGVPNYFGLQRFGRDGQNLLRARELFAGTAGRVDSHRRGIYLSAARAEVFNRILARRVMDGTWNRAIPGDVFTFSRSHGFFTADAHDPEILARISAREIHPGGTLWGRGEKLANDQAAAIETAASKELADLCRGLEDFGMECAIRPLRLYPENFHWGFPQADVLRLSFELPAGAYATTVLRELIATDAYDD